MCHAAKRPKRSSLPDKIECLQLVFRRDVNGCHAESLPVFARLPAHPTKGFAHRKKQQLETIWLLLLFSKM